MLATWAATSVASVRFGVPACTSLEQIEGFEPSSRYVKSITYAVSIALLVRSPLSTAILHSQVSGHPQFQPRKGPAHNANEEFRGQGIASPGSADSQGKDEVPDEEPQ
jgi:hypothetical protein